MKAIYKREVKSYFQSMIGYAFIAFMMLFVGIYFTAYNLNAGYPYFSYVLSATLFIFMIAVPVLTMKSFAEERKSKTDQLLLTAPVSVTGIVLGKFLAMITVFAIPVALSCVYPLVIKKQGTAYLKVDYAAILVYFVIGCVYIAIGNEVDGNYYATTGDKVVVYVIGSSVVDALEFDITVLEAEVVEEETPTQETTENTDEASEQ